MARAMDFDIRSALEPALAEAIDTPELTLALVCPEPVPAQSAAGLAHARACLGVVEASDLLLLHEEEAAGPGHHQTRH